MRSKVIGALVALAFAIGVVGVAPAMAAEGSYEVQGPEGTLTVTPVEPGELGASGVASPAINCSYGQVCAWAGFGAAGQESVWAESDTGCKSHLDNQPVRSGFNGTVFTERVGGYGSVAKHSYWEASGPVYGELCWPT